MASNEEMIALLRKIAEQGAAQSKALEGIQTQAVRQQQAQVTSGARSLGQAAGGAARGALGAVGLGGLAGALSGGPAGAAAYGVSTVVGGMVQDFSAMWSARYGTQASGYRGADPMASQREVEARNSFNVQQNQERARANRNFRGNKELFTLSPLFDWRMPWEKEKSSADAEKRLLEQRQKIAPQLYSADYARNQTMAAFAPQVANGGPVPTQEDYAAVEGIFKQRGDQMAKLVKLANEKQGRRVDSAIKNSKR